TELVVPPHLQSPVSILHISKYINNNSYKQQVVPCIDDCLAGQHATLAMIHYHGTLIDAPPSQSTTLRTRANRCIACKRMNLHWHKAFSQRTENKVLLMRNCGSK